jgi:hypothetical protein
VLSKGHRSRCCIVRNPAKQIYRGSRTLAHASSLARSGKLHHGGAKRQQPQSHSFGSLEFVPEPDSFTDISPADQSTSSRLANHKPPRHSSNEHHCYPIAGSIPPSHASHYLRSPHHRRDNGCQSSPKLPPARGAREGRERSRSWYGNNKNHMIGHQG